MADGKQPPSWQPAPLQAFYHLPFTIFHFMSQRQFISGRCFVSKTARTLAAAGFIIASAFPAFAQQKAQEPSKEQVQALIAQAMQQQSPSPATGASAMLVQPAGPTVNLTEAEAVARATDRNLTLISERI